MEPRVINTKKILFIIRFSYKLCANEGPFCKAAFKTTAICSLGSRDTGKARAGLHEVF